MPAFVVVAYHDRVWLGDWRGGMACISVGRSVSVDEQFFPWIVSALPASKGADADGSNVGAGHERESSMR
jgi:hypothetical protein